MLEDTAARALLNETEAARILAMQVTTLRRWRWAGRGPRYIKLCRGGAVRYDPADLATFIEAGRRRSTSEDCAEPAGATNGKL